MAEAFRLGKQRLANASELAHPHADAQIFLSVAASNSFVGAALQQEVLGCTRIGLLLGHPPF
jgi:hypothetical protein